MTLGATSSLPDTKRRRPALVFDEPRLGFAPMVVEKMHARFIAIRTSGVWMLLVEQNVSLALHSAERSYVMQSGETVMEGPAAELEADDGIRRLISASEERAADGMGASMTGTYADDPDYAARLERDPTAAAASLGFQA